MPDFKNQGGGEEEVHDSALTFHRIYENSADTAAQEEERATSALEIYKKYSGTTPMSNINFKKKAMAVTDRKVKKENIFQGAIKLKRVIPDKEFGKREEVDGKVVELTYVPQGVFNAYLNQQNKNVLEVYTINNNREVVFAKWTYENNEIKFSQASGINLATVMEKYTMPYDYLMMLNVYGDDVAFCMELAKVAIESEYIVAIQDKVITTYTKTSQIQTLYDEETGEPYTVDLGTVEEVLEQDSQKVELTYADSWSATVSNEVTYKDDEIATRDDIKSTSTGPTSTTEGDVTTTKESYSVTNQYSSGETFVDEEASGEKFVELFENSTNFSNIEPDWLFEAMNANASTTKLLDMTKYLLYKATGISYGVKEPSEVYDEFEKNEFKEVEKNVKGTVGWEFMRSWENNTLRKYMKDDGTYTYDSSTYIYSCVTEDRAKYILHDDIGQNKGNRNYGIGVKSYDNDTGYKWQNVDLFREQGINIKEGEYNIYGESQIDVEIIDNISMEIWNKHREKVKIVAKVKGVKLETYQIDALTDIVFAKGNIYSVIDAYKQYGLDEEKMKKACPEQFANERGNARWILFEEGRYCTPIEGEELDPSEYADADISELVNKIIETAKSKLGSPYEWGAHGPDSFDCTGFVEWVFRTNGIQVPWYTEDYKNYKQYEIDWDDLQPGDVVMLYNGEAVGGIGHAGIYIGEDQYIHCSGNVHISSLSNNQAGREGNPFLHVFRFIDGDASSLEEGNVIGGSSGGSTGGGSSGGSTGGGSIGSGSSSGENVTRRKNVSTLLSIIQGYSDQVEKDYKAKRYWEYSNGTRHPGNKKGHNTFERSKKGQRTCNCAKIASWAYHDLGITTPEDFYAKAGTGEIKMSKANRRRIEKYADIIRVNKKPIQLRREGNLKPGDVCMYPGHVNVYYGNGKWYDAGNGGVQLKYRSTFQRAGNTIYRFKSLGPYSCSYEKTKMVTYIIRLHDQT